jgi:hypothetical protein
MLIQPNSPIPPPDLYPPPQKQSKTKSKFVQEMAGLFYLKASKKDTQHVARFKYFGGFPPKKRNKQNFKK